MAVLVEAISVITRLDSVDRQFKGGRDGFTALIPNATSCADAHLLRVGFMTRDDTQQFVNQLVAGGLRLFDGQQFVDVAVVDQHNGPTAPTPWLNFYQITEDRIQFAALAGTDPGELVVPAEWAVETSLYRTGSFVPEDDVASRLSPLPGQGRTERVFDHLLGKEMFIGRTAPQESAVDGVPPGAGRQALLAYLEATATSMDVVRERLARHEINLTALPWEVRWGLYYAGLTDAPTLEP